MGSSPGWTQTFVPTAAQWNQAFANKQDDLGLSQQTIISLQAGGALLTNPMTSPGDLIVGGTAGIQTRLAALGAANLLVGGAAPSWSTGLTYLSGILTDTQSIGSTSTDGFVLQNTTLAAAGAQQWSPRFHWTAQGWKTNATAGSQPLDFIAELQAIQGAANPSGNWVLSAQVNGAGYSPVLTVTSPGALQVSATGSLGIGTDVLLTRAAAAALQFGAADAAAPIPQTSQVQNAAAGTANAAGANWTQQGSLSTGTGTAGAQILQTGFAGVTFSAASVSVTSASPGVVTLASHGFVPGQPFQFGGTTAPGGTTLGTTYYVAAAGLSSNAFEFSATPGGVPINTSTTGTAVTLSSGSNISSPQNPATAIATWGPSGLTGSQTTPVLSLQQTWNTSGAPIGLNLSVTAVNASPTSSLVNISKNGTSIWSIRQDGLVFFSNFTFWDQNGNISLNNIGISSASSINWANDTYIWRTAAKTFAFGGSTAGDTTGTVKASFFLSPAAAGGVGYTTGSGGTVTQLTSRTTGVTLNTVSGAITLVSAAGSASFQSFTVTDSSVAATDTVSVNQKSGTDKYQIFVTNVAAGSFQITYATTGGTTTEQPVFNFNVTKGSSN